MLRLAAPAIACLVLVFASAARAQPPGLTPEATRLADEKPVIELVTMGIGALIWERHGHIALCVRYDDPRDDVCYNYGVGDFHRPFEMAWGFFRATGAFWVDKFQRNGMLRIYQAADRTIWVQPLPLTQAQKRQVLDKLEHDILEPNRYYAYDHFIDNCTTRVRDILDNVTGGQLSAMSEPTDGRTFRDLAREGFYGLRWDHLGDPPLPVLATDLAMGRSTDRVPTYYERMFLPQYLREAVARRWGIQPREEYTRVGEPPSDDSSSGRGWLVLVVLVLTCPSWIARWSGRLTRAGVAVSVVPYVLLGTALTFLAIISPLPYIRWNECCLVLFPLDLLAVILPAAARRRYARGRLVMLAAIAVVSLVGVLKQPLLALLPWPAIPLAVVGLWPERRASMAGHAGLAEPGVRKSAPNRSSSRR